MEILQLTNLPENPKVRKRLAIEAREPIQFITSPIFIVVYTLSLLGKCQTDWLFRLPTNLKTVFFSLTDE
jgi:hypothetical protein